MKIISRLVNVITLLLLASTLICGIYIKTTGLGDINFHMAIAVASVVSVVIMMIMNSYIKKVKPNDEG